MKQVLIPKPDDGARKLGIPTVLDRLARGKPKRIKASDKSLKRFKQRIRVITRRTRGRTIKYIAYDLRQYLIGWKAYFGLSTVVSSLRDLDKWIRRKLRCYIWKQWRWSGYRKLRELGVSTFLAWNTATSAHGPWRISHSPALYVALPKRYFTALGIPALVECE